MQNNLFKINLFLFIIVWNNFSYSQTAKKYYASGNKLQKAANYKEALSDYSRALELEPDYAKAYIDRAYCYEQIGLFLEAAEDYKKATVFEPKNAELFYHTGRMFYKTGKFAAADEYLAKAIEKDKGFDEAIDLRIKTLVSLKKFDEGLLMAEKALDKEKTTITYFNHALLLDSLKLYDRAERSYDRAKYFDSKNIDAYIGLAISQAKQSKFGQGLASCDAAVLKNPSRLDIYEARATVNELKGDFQAAVFDLSKIITVQPNNVGVYIRRGNFYEKLSQYQNALADYTKVLNIDGQNVNAYFHRAGCYEAINDFKKAANDYKKIVTIAPGDMKSAVLLKEAEKKIFEFSREQDLPEIFITSHKIQNEKIIEVPGNASEIKIVGYVKDESKISSIKINDIQVQFMADTNEPSFSELINLQGKNSVKIEVRDVYDNIKLLQCQVKRTEVAPPIVKLISPYASDNGEVYLDNNESSVYIEGKIQDESLIRSIFIEGASASYVLEEMNPRFSANNINVANKNKIVIRATDVYGNEQVAEFKLNREGAAISADNPMGKTWVVFIENSNYASFSSLDGPSRDVSMMKSSLAGYKIHNIIHKKNMTKADLEKFFSIELRDLVRSNRVNSIMIWYAGHGKFINETGYWIPVDAKRDEEFTYFNINSLRAGMQSYSKYITHTLVITDACESGPSFYQAMRDTPKEKSCNDWEATKFKSSQVFSSAGYELASDNSQFTKTFSGSLSANPDACMSIEKIVNKVTEAVSKDQSQRPKFGKIAGLEDEEGTFFFIKK